MAEGIPMARSAEHAAAATVKRVAECPSDAITVYQTTAALVLRA